MFQLRNRQVQHYETPRDERFTATHLKLIWKIRTIAEKRGATIQIGWVILSPFQEYWRLVPLVRCRIRCCFWGNLRFVVRELLNSTLAIQLWKTCRAHPVSKQAMNHVVQSQAMNSHAISTPRGRDCGRVRCSPWVSVSHLACEIHSALWVRANPAANSPHV